MTPLAYIRKIIFKVSQAEMAVIAGVRQGTWSRWENQKDEPSRDAMSRIRMEAGTRQLPWNDKWFFEAPRSEGEAA